MGRWLTALREHENSKTALTETDKTDRTGRDGVLSVLSVRVGRVCEKSEPGSTERLVGAPCGSVHDQQPAPSLPAVLPEDWRALFDERAGGAKFEGGLPRARAEAQAFACCVAEWLARHPVHSAPAWCLGCGTGESAREPLLPFGTEASGHVWLHSRCWPAWYEAHRAEAAAAVAALGINPPERI